MKFSPEGQVPVAPQKSSELEPSLESQRRRRLIQAVVECISEVGFERTTMRKIAERAGVSTGMLTYYFRNKQELVNAAMVSVFQNSAGQVDEKADSTFGPRRLDVLLEQWFLTSDPELPSGSFMLRVRAAALASPEIREQAHASMIASLSKLERSIRAGMESSHYRDDVDPGLAAELIFGSMNFWKTQSATHGEIDPERGLEITRLVLQLLRKDTRSAVGPGERVRAGTPAGSDTSALDQIDSVLQSDENLTPDQGKELGDLIRKMYALIADSGKPGHEATKGRAP